MSDSEITVKCEEYKLFVENTGKLSETRGLWTQRLFLANITVYSAIFTVIGFWIQNKGFGGWLLAFSCLPLFIIGILSCLLWHHMIIQCKALIGWRYDALMTIERGLPYIHQM